MPRGWLGLVAFAAFELATIGASFGQTVTVDASEAIRQIHMSDMITSGEQLQQQRFQSMMQNPSGAEHGGGAAPHFSRSEIDALSRKTQALDAFVPDASLLKAQAHAYAKAYKPETGGEDQMLAGLIAQSHDTKGVERDYEDFVTLWHTLARKKNYGNRVSEAYLFLLNEAFIVRSRRLPSAFPDRQTISELGSGLQNSFVVMQVNGGHAWSNAEKQNTFDGLGVLGLVLGASSGVLGNHVDKDLAAEARAEANHLLATFGNSATDFGSLADGLQHRYTRAVLLNYQTVMALR